MEIKKGTIFIARAAIIDKLKSQSANIKTILL